jgi:hypothetical protein
MNRRGFLSSLFKGAIAAAVAPQIVTHGLKLRNGLWSRGYEPATIIPVDYSRITFLPSFQDFIREHCLNIQNDIKLEIENAHQRFITRYAK